jgi:cell division septation protein DedD
MRFPFATACLTILLAAGVTPCAQATVKDGVDAWQARNYAAAVAAWRGPAAAGDADAQFNLAQAYKLGRGVPANLGTARTLFEKAAVQGHEQAQANLGLILFQAGERKAAMPWLQRAAQRGEPRAQYVVGTAHFNGDLATKDWPRAYALMTRAAASGLPQAGRSLAEMEKFIPIGQRQQGTQIAASLAAAESAANTGEDRAEMAMALPAPAPATSSTAARSQRPAPVRPAPPAPIRTVSAPLPAPAPPAASDDWRVQLGAFATPAAAQAAWGSLTANPGLAGLRAQYTKAGAVVRLQAGPLADRAAATRACAAVTRAGKGCFPVAP